MLQIEIAKSFAMIGGAIFINALLARYMIPDEFDAKAPQSAMRNNSDE